jgi:hypothetical protein
MKKIIFFILATLWGACGVQAAGELRSLTEDVVELANN